MQKLVLERNGSNFYQVFAGTDVHHRNPFYGFLPAEALQQTNVRKDMDDDQRFKQMRETELTKRFMVKLRDRRVTIPLNVHGNFR